jgi:hypothetical protein
MELFGNWGDLAVASLLLQNMLTSPSTRLMECVPLDQIHDPTLLSYDTAYHRFLAVWKSFGKQGPVSLMKIRSTTLQQPTSKWRDWP